MWSPHMTPALISNSIYHSSDDDNDDEKNDENEEEKGSEGSGKSEEPGWDESGKGLPNVEMTEKRKPRSQRGTKCEDKITINTV